MHNLQREFVYKYMRSLLLTEQGMSGIVKTLNS